MQHKLFFIQVIAIFVCLWLIAYVEFELKPYVTHSISIHAYVVISQLLYIPVGMLLVLPKWMSLLKRDGRIKVHLWKLMVLGGPSLYVIAVPYLLKVESLLPLFFIRILLLEL
ncbi:hypothetical protein H0266_05680 [Halobacillus locisalis]|uniref:Uncharacterized protein n=1 Tax=Halobacillus locisalis TaxID=220753 RepID=A0A838CR20_9BACI|nr:hypothetical protein [Halobacillus locisalis]MBA2174394.1 hypothetical protein [Halobacillus locisalis]